MISLLDKKHFLLILIISFLLIPVFISAEETDLLPKGYFDFADCNHFTGWACDADNYSQQLMIHFYTDGPAGSQTGKLLGATLANIPREQAVGDICGGNINHGFDFIVPSWLKDGNSHTIYAYAINIPSGTNNPLLTHSPKTVDCPKVSACTDECSGIGARQCFGSGYKICGNYDSDSCLEGGSLNNCNSYQRCENGSCVDINSAEEGKLNLYSSVTVATKSFVKYIFSFPATNSINITGLTGNVSLTNTSNNLAQSLITIDYNPEGCPENGLMYNTYEDLFAKYPKALPLFSYILKSSSPETVTIPTEVTFPVKIPIKGCVFIILDGGEPAYGSSVTMTSNMSLLYDTESAPISNLTFLRGLGYEFCYGQNWGCQLSTICTTDKCAFAKVVPINSYTYLKYLFGDVSAGAFTGSPYANPPIGQWSADFDYYIYNDCSDIPQNQVGPDDYYSRIPISAVRIVNIHLDANGKVSKQKEIAKQLSLLLKPGNCLVSLVKFTSSNGGATLESQVKALLQNAEGTLLGRIFIDANNNGVYDKDEVFVKDSSANCTSGTNISGLNITWTGLNTGKTTVNKCNPEPYYSTSLLEGNYSVSLELPSGWETTTTTPLSVKIEAGQEKHLWIGINTTKSSNNPVNTSTPNISSTTVAETTNKTIEELQQVVNQLIEQLRSLLIQLVSKGGTIPKGLEQYLTNISGQTIKVSDVKRDLYFNVRDDDVKILQTFLINQNKGINATRLKGYGATGYFGYVTKATLTEYQKAVGIKPAVGYFGPITRSYLKSIGY